MSRVHVAWLLMFALGLAVPYAASSQVVLAEDVLVADQSSVDGSLPAQHLAPIVGPVVLAGLTAEPVGVPAAERTVLVTAVRQEERNRAAMPLMIAGGAAFVAGLIAGGDAGTILMIGGGAAGAYGLYLYF